VDEVEVLEKKKSALELLEEAKRFTTTILTFPVHRTFSLRTIIRCMCLINRGKMLKEIDHSKIEYMPFRKNLYIVPKALSRLTELEAQEKRYLE
jgi:hypothetical protein